MFFGKITKANKEKVFLVAPSNHKNTTYLCDYQQSWKAFYWANKSPEWSLCQWPLSHLTGKNVVKYGDSSIRRHQSLEAYNYLNYNVKNPLSSQGGTTDVYPNKNWLVYVLSASYCSRGKWLKVWPENIAETHPIRSNLFIKILTKKSVYFLNVCHLLQS